MATSFRRLVVAAFRRRSLAEILAAPPDALLGLSRADAERLHTSFGIRTVRQVAENRFFRAARTLLAGTGIPAHDPGPPPAWEALFDDAPLDHYRTHPARRFRTEFGPVFYRGRLDGTARLLVVGQDPATDEILASRAFVGLSGQRLQGFLHRLGVRRSYVMVNTFLYGVYGQFDAQLRDISLEPRVLGFRNTVLDRLGRDNPLEAVITIGAGARHAVEQWPGAGTLPVFELIHPAAPEAMVIPDWNRQLPRLHEVVEPDEGAEADLAPYGPAFAPEDHAAIPRVDLPFGVPDWLGTGGSRSRRDGAGTILWTAP
jgi:uracil-DNA glycosylase